MTALELILQLAEGSTTPNTLQHIAKIARDTIKALDGLGDHRDIADIIAGELKVSRGTAYDMMRETLKDAAPVQEPMTEREKQIVMFAVHHFMSVAYAQANAAAQDHNNRYFNPGAADAFFKDAKDAEALIHKLREKNTGKMK